MQTPIKADYLQEGFTRLLTYFKMIPDLKEAMLFRKYRPLIISCTAAHSLTSQPSSMTVGDSRWPLYRACQLRYVTLRNLVSMFTLDFINFRCLSHVVHNVIFVDMLVFCRIEQF